ncbi:MAG: ATP-binding cassette domain-containing protein [Candidatus Aenigmatarchaeota archaeon]
MYTIETESLRKEFKNIVAVDDLNLKVNKGEIFGLLGPNGAGKTTTISMLCTILEPTSGKAFVNGYDVVKDQDKVRKSIGIVFQDPSLDDRLTARENLEMHASLYGVKEKKQRIKEVLELVELTEKANTLVKTYSGGMKRRLEIARGLVHHPEILFLDEPTLGLDPQTRAHIWDYIRDLVKKENITIILTTHYMEEADSLCDRIAIIDHGKIIACDTSEKLKKTLKGESIILKVSDNKKAEKYLDNAKTFDGKIAVYVKNAEKEITKILFQLKKHKIDVYEVSIRKPSLNDVFLALTGREIRDEENNKKLIRRGPWS